MREKLPLDIDFDEKEIRIVNNRRLYEFIESGAAAALVPLWGRIRSVAETIEPEYGVLTRVLEAVFLYHIFQYSLTHHHVIRRTLRVEDAIIAYSASILPEAAISAGSRDVRGLNG